METERITIQVDLEAARVFKSASAEDRRKLEALLSIRTVTCCSRRFVPRQRAADEENPLIARLKAPHNRRIEQTPPGHSSSTARYAL
jgi:hypothetical protein